ncbi:hypothetical protein DFA_04968 [Cavenderia fasciculata]|uniref:IPT/TIG domain-containing protein n=1 Tax=Cavenderia fasciculata TaxID=261658 RepID=F4PMP1_CACFS|nr:uncharacterized protein DFA_04968 [Cavenderia fasciculata]EGG22838.1 hypothetical protein DFA_04968 [Cavenderia fasciculata]|eukprot:XP_004360689.1 hypothetical protein DFA_04968 [Cavenderia fasciculata]
MYKSQFVLLLVATFLLLFCSSNLVVAKLQSNYGLSSLTFDGNQTITAIGSFGDDSSLVSVWVGDQNNTTPCPIVSFYNSSISCTINPRPSGTKNVFIGINNGNQTVLEGSLSFSNATTDYYISHVAYNNTDNTIKILGSFGNDGSNPNPQPPQSNYTLSSLTFGGNQTITATGSFGDDSSLVSIWVGDQYTPCPLVSFSNSSLSCIINPVPIGTKTVSIRIGSVVLNGVLFFKNVTNHFISYVSYNDIDNSLMIVGSLDNNTVGATHVYVTFNGWVQSFCAVTSVGPSFVNCQLNERLQTNKTYDILLHIDNQNLYSTVYIPSANPNPNYYFSSFRSTIYPLGLEVSGSFGNTSTSVNITINYGGQVNRCPIYYFSSTYLLCNLGNNYPVNGGYYQVNGAIDNVIYNSTNVYFEPTNSSSSSSSSSSTNSSSSSSSSNNNSSSSSSSSYYDVTCSLSRTGQLKVEYSGDTLINCTSQGISQCNSPVVQLQCQGLTSSSLTRCLAPHEIVCQGSSSVVCRVGGMSCSIEGGQLTITADTTATFNHNENPQESNSQTNDTSSASFSTLFILSSLLSVIYILI